MDRDGQILKQEHKEEATSTTGPDQARSTSITGQINKSQELVRAIIGLVREARAMLTSQKVCTQV